MVFITPEHHPDWVATLTATPDTIVAAANRAFELIHIPQYRAVCVFLQTDTQARSIDMIKTAPNVISPAANFLLVSGNIISTEDYKRILTPDKIASIYGPDFATMVKFCRSLGPGSIAIRSTNGNSETPHIDYISPFSLHRNLSNNFKNSAKNTKAPESSLSVTMTIEKNGTDLIKTHPDELWRTKEEWKWKPKGPIENRILYNNSKTITVMRSRTWDKSHPPSAHKTPLKSYNNKDTRTVGVGFIKSLG